MREISNEALEPVFKKFLELLNKHKIKYLVIGGYAVAVHGYVRATGDIDIWINPSKENAENMLLVMIEFGFDVYDFRVEDFLIDENDKGGFISFGEVPFKIEILSDALGVSFEEAYQNRWEVQMDNISVNFIGIKDLIKNKKAVGRPKDLLDIENLPDA